MNTLWLKLKYITNHIAKHNATEAFIDECKKRVSTIWQIPVMIMAAIK
jgi:hypothetical protein